VLTSLTDVYGPNLFPCDPQGLNPPKWCCGPNVTECCNSGGGVEILVGSIILRANQIAATSNSSTPSIITPTNASNASPTTSPNPSTATSTPSSNHNKSLSIGLGVGISLSVIAIGTLASWHGNCDGKTTYKQKGLEHPRQVNGRVSGGRKTLQSTMSENWIIGKTSRNWIIVTRSMNCLSSDNDARDE
jgi:hypothetical protein